MKMTIMGHLKELKNRAIWSLLFFAVAAIVGLYVAPFLQGFIARPILSQGFDAMIYTGVADGVSIQFSLAGLFALFIGAPFFLWQIWAYIAPALKKEEKKFAIPFVILSPVLFVAGSAFAYFVLMPLMMKFFISVGTETAVYMPSAKNYLGLCIAIMKSFGLAFQLPLLLIMLNRLGFVTRKQVFSFSRYILIGIFVVSAILTPPDIVSQIALAIPLLALFGLSFVFMI